MLAMGPAVSRRSVPTAEMSHSPPPPPLWHLFQAEAVLRFFFEILSAMPRLWCRRIRGARPATERAANPPSAAPIAVLWRSRRGHHWRRLRVGAGVRFFYAICRRARSERNTSEL